MAKGKFEFEHPGMPVGDHFIRVRNQDMPAPSTEGIVLALHQDILQHEPICKEDDWLVVAQVPNLETLDRLVANFPNNFRWFNVPEPELVRDGMPAAFLWISELRGQPSHHDAYTHAERLMIDVQPLLKTLMHNFGGIRLTKEVAKLNMSPPQTYSMVNLTGFYSAPTLVRVLPPEAMKAMSAAPRSTDYTSPTWGEYLQTKMAQDDQTFRKIIRHVTTKTSTSCTRQSYPDLTKTR